MSSLKIFCKLFFFCGILCVIIMMFKKVINLPENDAMIDAIEQSQKGEDSSCYIIGSSRVQSSFDPSILKHCFNNVNVYNW